MPRMFQLGNNHPLAVASAGAVSGGAAWFMAHAEAWLTAFRLIGGFCGSLLTVISVVMVLPKAIRFARRAWALGFTQADKE